MGLCRRPTAMGVGQAYSAMLLAAIFLTASADAISIHRILPGTLAGAAEDSSNPLTSRPSRSLEEFSVVNQKQTSSLEPFLRYVRTTTSNNGDEAENELTYEELLEQERRLDLLCATVIEALRTPP